MSEETEDLNEAINFFAEIDETEIGPVEPTILRHEEALTTSDKESTVVKKFPTSKVIKKGNLFQLGDESISILDILEEMRLKDISGKLLVGWYDGGNDSGFTEIIDAVKVGIREALKDDPHDAEEIINDFNSDIAGALGHGSWASDGITWVGNIFWDGENFLKEGREHHQITREDSAVFEAMNWLKDKGIKRKRK